MLDYPDGPKGHPKGLESGERKQKKLQKDVRQWKQGQNDKIGEGLSPRLLALKIKKGAQPRNAGSF